MAAGITKAAGHRTDPRRVVFGVMVALFPIALLALALVVAAVVKVPELFVEPVYRSARVEAEIYAPRVLADARVAAQTSLGVANPGGADAGPFLNPIVPWVSPTDTAPRSPGPVGDVEWMAHLSEFDTWDIENNSDAVDPRANVFARAIPDGVWLRRAAQRRLELGMANGDLEAARGDVEQLARLMLQTESLLMVSVGLKMLGEARPEQAASIEALRRLTFAQASWAVVPMGVHTMRRARDPNLAPLRCAGLNEALGWDLGVRALLHDVFPREYEEAGRILETSECRLSIVRRAWASSDGAGELPDGPRAFCFNEEKRTGLCRLPDLVHWIPGVRRAVGGVLASISLMDGFGRYRPAGLNAGYDPEEELSRALDAQRRVLRLAASFEPTAEGRAQLRDDEQFVRTSFHIDVEKARRDLDACGCRTSDGPSFEVTCSSVSAGATEAAVVGKTIYCPALALRFADVRITRFTFDLAQRSSTLRFRLVGVPHDPDAAVWEVPALPSGEVIDDIALRGGSDIEIEEARANLQVLATGHEAVEFVRRKQKVGADIAVILLAEDARVSVARVATHAMLAGSTPLVERFDIEEGSDRQVARAAVSVVAGQEQQLLRRARELPRVALEVEGVAPTLVLRFSVEASADGGSGAH